MSDIKERLDKVRALIQEPEFLEGKGLSNEVNIRIFCYEPENEMVVRHFVNQLETDQSLECHLKICNLYKTFLSICDAFYSDHCKIYQKRPIYWLFDSGKKNGFKALIYMHRYQPDTIARIRTDYVHEQQARYRTAIADLGQRIANASTGERVKLNKKLTALQAQDTEIRTYEEKIHHLADQMISIDLDDGVKKNYAIFQDVLAKIK